ncbi:AAA family ATPase, partial [uncultured Megasphaera sp.]|uniref:AAA family ATPase n=1 Tax=uncultured Megasphaera sp. TaxID=165188 RepID=UPI00265D3BA0
SILPILESMMQGRVVIKNEEFYIEKYDGRRVNFSLEAEGLKKVGLLWQLLMNESITEGCIVLWDEPEANVNPKFIPVLVDCMLALSRHGVQICLSTHSYILAKYIEIKMNENDAVQFHSLYQTKKGVQCESCHTFQDLRHNSIMKGFEALMEDVYDKQIKQMGD